AFSAAVRAVRWWSLPERDRRGGAPGEHEHAVPFKTPGSVLRHLLFEPSPSAYTSGAMDWNDLRHFLALARTGSARAAGGLLGVSHSTVSRRVEALEAELGVRLFDRHRDGYLLTDAGKQMVPG